MALNFLNNSTLNGTFTVSGNTTLSTIPSVGSNTDKFLMSNNGLISFATAAEVLTYIGGAPASGGDYLPLAGGTMDSGANISMSGTLFITSSIPRIIFNDSDGTNQIGEVFASNGNIFFDSRDGNDYGSFSFVRTNNTGSLTAMDITSADGDVRFFNSIQASGYIKHLGDTNTAFGFPANNTIAFDTNNSERMRINSAGAIRFNAYGAGTLVTDADGNITVSSGGSGTVTGITEGPGITVTASATSPTVSVDYAGSDSLVMEAADAVPDQDDYIIFGADSSGGGDTNKIQFTDVNLSLFNNDSGFTSNAGTVTSVGSGTGLTGGPFTVSGSIAVDYVGTDSIIKAAPTASASILTSDFLLIATSNGNVYETTFSNLPLDNYNRWRVQANTGLVYNVTSDTNVDFIGGTNISTSTGTQAGGLTVTINNDLTNNNQLTNGAGYITASSTNTLTNKSGLISQWTNDSGYVTGGGSIGDYLPLAGGTMTGKAVFPSAIASRPQLPGGFIAIDTGDADVDIWGISRDYYPSNPTTANAWGLKWGSSPNQFQWVGAGVNRITFDLDQGNIVTLGNITLSGGGARTIQSGGDIALKTSTGDYAFYGAANGNTNLYYNGLQKLRTGSVGVVVTGNIELSTIANETSAAGKFLVPDSNGVVKYRTGAQVLSDIAALPLAGGTMSGNIAMANFNITGVNQLVINDPGEGIVFTGTASMILAAIDDATDSILRLQNSTQFNLNSTARITGLVNPTGAQDAATKNYVDTEVGNIPSGLSFEGNWNASTDSPSLAGTTPGNGIFYIVSVAGSTNLSGITDWEIGDWAVFVSNGAGTDAWQKVDNSSTLSGLGAAGKVAFWSTTSNVSFNNNFSYDGSNLTAPRLRVGAGTDGYFYSDTAGRTAFASGDFYIQSSVNNYYNYATNIYLGDTTGDSVLFRGSTITGTSWGITPAGAATFGNSLTVAGNQYFNGEFIEGDGKEMFKYNDDWLRINEDNDFSSGIYCGTGVLRTDGAFQVGSSGTKFLVTAAGAVTAESTLTLDNGQIVLGGTGRIQGVNTVSASTDAANKAYVDAHGGGLGPFLPIANPTFTGTLTGPAATITTVTGALVGNATTASSAAQVTINYNNNSNANYQLLWGSGNNVYGTGGVYVNPNSNNVYATTFTGALTGNATTATTATTAGTLTHNTNRTDSTSYPVTWMSGSPSPAYSCAAVTITSSVGQVNATTFNGALTGNATSASLLQNYGGFTTQGGNGTVNYVYAINSTQTGLFAASDNSNSILTLNRHPGNYYSQLGFSSNGNLYYRKFSNVAINTTQGWNQIAFTSSLSGYLPVNNPTFTGTLTGPAATITTVTGALAGNADTATLAANSTLAGGLAIESGQTNNGVNKIVRTTVNGYVNFGWINSASGATTSTITRITASNDAYLRYVTPATFRTQITDPYYAPASGSGSYLPVANPTFTGTLTGPLAVVTGNIKAGSLSDDTFTRFTNPDGASYVTQASSVTGAIAITLPIWGAPMVRMTIKIYEYATNESFTVSCGGHTSGTNWYNPFAYIVGNPSKDRRFTVRFGRSASSLLPVVYIGELASTWSYPQVWVTDVQVGFASISASWASGWSIAFRTGSYENVTQTISNSQVGYQQTANTANSVVLRDSSGNFSAGTITASLSGNASTVTNGVYTTGNQTIGGSKSFSATVLTSSAQSRNKFSVWSNSTEYTIGMMAGYTYGGLGNEYAMSFQMNNNSARGFWWGDVDHTNAQGAMALTTNGLLTVANAIRLGYGETDTTSPGGTFALNVSGAGLFTGLVSGITPTASANFTTKGYVDAAVAGVPQGDVTGTGTNDVLPMWNAAGTGIEDSPFAMGNVDQYSSNTDLIIKSNIGHHGNLTTYFGFINTNTFRVTLNNAPYLTSTVADTYFAHAVRVGATNGVGIYSSNPANIVRITESNSNIKISTIPNATSDTDKFLVSDSGEIKYRTGAEVRSDIGAGTGDGDVTGITVSNGITGSSLTGPVPAISMSGTYAGNFNFSTNNFLVGGTYASNSYDTSAAGVRILLGGGNSDSLSNYYIGTNLENFGGNYTKLDLAWHTGIRMGAQAVYGGTRIYDSEDFGTVLFSVGTSGTNVAVTNNLTIGSDLTVSGGDITLGGISGKISGVVTVLSGTDATSKTYVDGAISTAGNAFLPKAGGVMSGKIGRSSAITGFLEGSYNNVGDNATNSNPIYTIGSSYNPAATTLSNMYGIGYTNAASSSFVSLTGAAGWGMYVAADGDARIFLDGSNGRISASGTIYAPNATITTVTGNLTGTASNATLAANSTLAGGLAIGSGVNNSANQIVRTNSAGYADFGWINSVSGVTTSTITRITASNDAYLRYVTPATFRSQVIAPYFAPSSTVSGVTSIATTSPILGGTITGTGTLSLKVPVSGAWHNGGVAIVGAVTEVGRYIDFHTSNTGTSDYDIRLDANGSELNCSGNIRSQGNLEAVGNIVAGRAKFTSGTAALPSFSFTSDPDTGLSNPAANTMQLSTGGSYRWSVNNFATVIYQDVGIGVTPLAKFHVNGVSLVRSSTGVGDFYLGNKATANHFRFHTNNSNTYFDMNCGNVYWRQGSSSRYTFFPSTANMTVNGTITQNSDIRIKENVIEIGDCISKVQAMRGVYYNRTDFNTEVTKVGVIAQEVEAVLPELILESPDDGFKSVAYSELTAVLINAIKEQQEIIEDLKTRITKLEK